MLTYNWIDAHAADAPWNLVERVKDALTAVETGDSGDSADGVGAPHLANKADTTDIADSLLRAGEYLLERVIAAGSSKDKDVALDLLAADACVTWAFEAAADQPETIVLRAQDAIQRIAGIPR